MNQNIETIDYNIFSFKNSKKIIEYGDVKLAKELEVIPTGSLMLDNALGIGGIPRGKIIEVYGNESSGKTTLALQIIKKAQEMNLKCLFLDLENTLNINYLKKIGIDISRLLIANPTSGEQCFDIIDSLIKNKAIDLIVVDSVAAMMPMNEAEGEFDSIQIGSHARLMSKGLRKIQSSLFDSNCTIIFINQIREKIGVMFGNNETTTGGNALKFFSSIRMEIKKSELLKSGLEKIGIKSKITIVKNKMSAPLKVAYFDIYFDSGYNEKNEIIEFAIKFDVIQKSGSWYSYDSKKLCQGIDQLKKIIEENNELYEDIKNKTLSKLN